jgi:hypothetical protein
MIKLLRRLVIRYRDQKRIFVSWDSASWHASKMLYKIVDEMNCDEFRSRHKTPVVELIPLPTGAQFLNVIESVLSGMARAILHNSNYGNVEVQVSDKHVHCRSESGVSGETSQSGKQDLG